MKNQIIVELPKTVKAAKESFSDPALQRIAISAARFTGRVLMSTIALTASGQAAADAVDAIAQKEFAELGYDKVFVGEGDPKIFGRNVPVAYLDQPRSTD